MAYLQLAGKDTDDDLPHYMSLPCGVRPNRNRLRTAVTNEYFSVILITVLTNSFMAIASNATEEHQ